MLQIYYSLDNIVNEILDFQESEELKLIDSEKKDGKSTDPQELTGIDN